MLTYMQLLHAHTKSLACYIMLPLLKIFLMGKLGNFKLISLNSVWAHVHLTVSPLPLLLWKSEDNLWESVPSSAVGPRD